MELKNCKCRKRTNQ